MRIEQYGFGHIIVDGQSYTRDLILLPHRVISDWWREQGHSLSVSDLKAVSQASEQVGTLIIGTGAYGLMTVPLETRDYLDELGIRLVIRQTESAVQEYNRRCEESPSVAAALHLTC